MHMRFVGMVCAGIFGLLLAVPYAQALGVSPAKILVTGVLKEYPVGRSFLISRMDASMPLRVDVTWNGDGARFITPETSSPIQLRVGQGSYEYKFVIDAGMAAEREYRAIATIASLPSEVVAGQSSMAVSEGGAVNVDFSVTNKIIEGVSAYSFVIKDLSSTGGVAYYSFINKGNEPVGVGKMELLNSDDNTVLTAISLAEQAVPALGFQSFKKEFTFDRKLRCGGAVKANIYNQFGGLIFASGAVTSSRRNCERGYSWPIFFGIGAIVVGAGGAAFAVSRRKQKTIGNKKKKK